MWEDNENEIMFRIKKGHGPHIFNDKRGTVTAGQAFRATPFEVRHIEHKLDAMEPIPETAPEPDVPRFEIVHKGGKYFDVVNQATGEKLNDKGITLDEAKELAGVIDDGTGDETEEAEAEE